jgi:magnesium chelatase subunit D
VRRNLAGSASPLPLRPIATDWHLQRFALRPRRLVLFAVDVSDSMGDGPETRMAAALGAAAAFAGRAYLHRDQVALITFRDRVATLAVPPTGSVRRVRDRLNQLTVGGATPLADGLRLARDTLRRARRKDSALDAVLVLVSDGEATVPLRRNGDPFGDALAIARELHQDGVTSILIDTGSVAQHQRRLPYLAEVLGGQCRRLRELSAQDILQLLDAPARNSLHP